MKTFQITETAVYTITAATEERALEKFLASQDPNEWFSHIEDRYVDEVKASV